MGLAWIQPNSSYVFCGTHSSLSCLSFRNFRSSLWHWTDSRNYKGRVAVADHPNRKRSKTLVCTGSPGMLQGPRSELSGFIIRIKDITVRPTKST